jgi:zinc transport system ATP-binding protein
MTSVIKFSNVSKKFDNKDLIFNVSFEVKKGETTTLIGPNGAGKTTIAKLILGLEKQTSGEIDTEQNLKIGYVPQKLGFNNNLPISAEKFLSFFELESGDSQDPRLLDFIDFKNIKDKDIKSLSGGQMQKLILIAALLNKPQLLILDEPTKSMDVNSQQEFYKLIELVKIEYNLTIFMISHDLFTVIKSSDQVLCLNGHICCSGRPNRSEKEFKELISELSSIGFYNHHHDHRH